jgi:signal transduction histidine kinase
MKNNCYRLLRLLNNLIDITRIDSGYINLNLTDCNIVSAIEDITQSVVEYAQSCGITLIFDTVIEEKLMAVDTEKLERIILNLLSNAIKFTKPGGNITVAVSEDDANAIISVKDTGIGIPESKLKVIFERFRQVDNSLNRNYEGSGIGLSLVKSLVEMHNGSVYVKSHPGIGSEFIVNIPSNLISGTPVLPEDKNIISRNVNKTYIELADVNANHDFL